MPSPHHTTRTSGRPGAPLLGRLAALTAALLTAMLALGALTSPASAERRVIPDRGGPGDGLDGGISTRPGGLGDVDRLVVTYTWKRLVVRVEPTKRGGLADFYDLFLDYDRSNPGPEFQAGGSTETESAGTSTTDRFPADNAAPISGRSVCQDLPFRRTGEKQRGQGVIFSIPRRCLGDAPRDIRLSLRTNMPQGDADWVPAARRFSAPVTRGPVR